MRMLVPNSNGVIHEDELNFDKVPVAKYKEVMGFLMELGTPPDDASVDEEWEGGGDSHDEL